jgi:hypothetical protein
MKNIRDIIKGLKCCKLYNKLNCDKCPYDYNGRGNEKNECTAELATDVLSLLQCQETEWEHLWDAPDGTYKGRCKKCGYVHFFIGGHDIQYKFCPECGRAAKWAEPTAGTNKIPLKW